MIFQNSQAPIIDQNGLQNLYQISDQSVEQASCLYLQ